MSIENLHLHKISTTSAKYSPFYHINRNVSIVYLKNIYFFSWKMGTTSILLQRESKVNSVHKNYTSDKMRQSAYPGVVDRSSRRSAGALHIQPGDYVGDNRHVLGRSLRALTKQASDLGFCHAQKKV